MVTTVSPAQPATGFGLPHSAEGIYFHADDIGATPAVTTRLCDAWETGLVDGFSVFGDCDHPEILATRLAFRPERPARISAHLNLWEGQPLSPASDVPRLVDRSGYFNIEFTDLLRRRHERDQHALLAEIEREWRAQIERVGEMISPRRLACLDGHLHMHMAPQLFRLAVRLAGDYGISEIRNVREPFYLSRSSLEMRSKRFFVNCAKRTILWRFGRVNAVVAANAGLRSPDRMLGVLYSGLMSRANIIPGITAARRQGAKRIEVLVHIGRAEASELGRFNGSRNKASFVMSPARDAEYDELLRLRRGTSPDWSDRQAS
jgi:predicted glycoside hydrolase/deacetylase ChbG (UPF0249 family)